MMTKDLRFLPPISDGMQVLQNDIEVAGIQYRLGNAVTFARRKEQRLELEREPTNKYDRNAIKVFGISKGWFLWSRLFIGYLPAEVAKWIAKENLWGKIAPRLRNIWHGGYHRDYIVIRLDIVGPKPERVEKPKKTRRKK